MEGAVEEWGYLLHGTEILQSFGLVFELQVVIGGGAQAVGNGKGPFLAVGRVDCGLSFALAGCLLLLAFVWFYRGEFLCVRVDQRI
jgi:hypothetical protein